MIHRCHNSGGRFEPLSTPLAVTIDGSSRLELMLNFTTPSTGDPDLLVDKPQDARGSFVTLNAVKGSGLY
jgi:hypothetical protein